MGLFLHFLGRPSPWSRSADIADHGLPTIGNVDMLDRHLLLALRTIVLEGRDLSGERARELVEGVLSAVLLPTDQHRKPLAALPLQSLTTPTARGILARPGHA